MKPKIPEVLPFAKEYYSLHGAGGNLHIILDDGNIDDDDIEFCLQCSKNENDLEGIKLAELLLKMSKTQRRKIYMSCITS